MGGKDQVRSSLEKDSLVRKRRSWHSKAYDRFFEGYSEFTVPKTDGKGYKIQRVYTGNYYCQDLTKGQRILFRLLYFVLFLCAMYLFISSASSPLVMNSTWYVVITQVICIPFLFWIGITLVFYYLPAQKNLTIHEYRSSSLSLQKAALGSSICLSVVAFSALIFVLLNQSIGLVSELVCVIQLFTGGLLMFLIYRIEKNVKYQILPSQNKPPADALIINK